MSGLEDILDLMGKIDETLETLKSLNINIEAMSDTVEPLQELTVELKRFNGNMERLDGRFGGLIDAVNKIVGTGDGSSGAETGPNFSK